MLSCINGDATYCSMKMSLCNAFRLFVVSILVLSIIDTPAAFTLRRTNAKGTDNDLAQEESVVLEVKHDLNRPNKVPIDLRKNTSTVKSSDAYESTAQLHTDEILVTTEKPTEASSYQTTDTSNTEQETFNDNAFQNTNNNYESTSLYMSTEIASAKTDLELLTASEEEDTTSTVNSFVTPVSTITKFGSLLEEPKTLPTYKVTKPFWKKYTTIERTRPTTITPIVLKQNETANSNKIENVLAAVTKSSGNSLTDASDIASLEKLKIELLLTTQKHQQQASENKFSRLLTTEPIMTDQPNSNAFTNIEDFPTTELSISKYTVESKRAGYLNFSGKSTAEEVAITTAISYSGDKRNPLHAMFEVENETDVPEEKRRAESQSQLNEDALKEELLKEDTLIDNAENAKRFREEILMTPDVNPSLEFQINNPQGYSQNSLPVDEKLKVRPINMTTEKNTILYPINPNYKPLKKIDVKPLKPFIRDPDDNSWRNESLSSLGIVFKSKNSSKPFTQVLKNKTESEWNKLSEKDDKNEIPDLRERLQKMAEMRKSKKKKTDSLGNVVYFDYEENISGEKVNSSKEELITVVNTTTSLVPSASNISSVPLEQSSDKTTISTTEASTLKIFDVPSSRKPKKFFNVPEYYDNTDDDVDYLNMAKIDIKKFSTLKTPSTTRMTQTWPEPKVTDKLTPITWPERKATVQYFPPLTTQKVNINDYDNDFKFKVNSFTTVSELPKHVLPVSTISPIPVQKTTTQYNKYKNNRNEFTAAPQTNIVKDLYLTGPPMTTDLYTLPGDSRDGYVIKHFRDFVNQAAKDEEYEKNMDYPFTTEAPVQGVTKTDFNAYERQKSRINIGDDYDYETQFRKDVLQRFVDNFNHNSHRFKADFPILFNSSVIHGETNNGRDIASSRAFMRGLYENKMKPRSRPCDPHCDNITVELSPAYELHYYVPDQEERQEALPPPTIAYPNM